MQLLNNRCLSVFIFLSDILNFRDYMISQIPLFLRSLDHQDLMMKIFLYKLVNMLINNIAIGYIRSVMNSMSNILNLPNVNQENKTE